jgi:transposase
VSNVLNEEQRKRIMALGQLGWSLRQIESATGIRRETVSGYLRAAGIAVGRPGRPPNPANPPGEVTTGSTQAKSANPAISPIQATTGPDPDPDPAPDPEPEPSKPSESVSACEAYREIIETALAKGRNAMSIWQGLVDQHGFASAYESVKRFVRKLRGTATPEARAVIETEPGEEAQVDYGSGPMVMDPRTGKLRRTRLFVMTLGYSRKSIRLLTFLSSTQIWCQLHEQAFRRLGGVPRIVVLDNLGEGVLKPDIYDPAINPLYRDVLAHYGAVAMPCRVADPDRKGKVERGVGHAKQTPLKGMRFEQGMEEAQTYLDRWEERWADKRIHGTTKRQVAAMFDEEKPFLLPLPLEPFRFYQYGKRRVHLDGCVEVEAAYYSVPPGHVGRDVSVQWNDRWVRILHAQTGQLLREHLRLGRGHRRIAVEDRSKRTAPGLLHLLARANHAGQRIGEFCGALHARDGNLCARHVQGTLSLLKKYGVARLEQACEEALELRVHQYHFVRRYLERQSDTPISLRQIDPLIRDLTTYRDLIASRTNTNSPNSDSQEEPTD